jgi:hypothetical protein
MSDSEFGTPPGYDGSELPPGGYAGPPGLTPEQLAYQRGQQDTIRRMTTPRMTAWRVICGVLWLVLSVGFAVGAIYNLAHSDVADFLLGLVFAVLAGWYDYRIWTLKARRLFFII